MSTTWTPKTVLDHQPKTLADTQKDEKDEPAIEEQTEEDVSVCRLVRFLVNAKKSKDPSYEYAFRDRPALIDSVVETTLSLEKDNQALRQEIETERSATDKYLQDLKISERCQSDSLARLMQSEEAHKMNEETLIQLWRYVDDMRADRNNLATELKEKRKPKKRKPKEYAFDWV